MKTLKDKYDEELIEIENDAVSIETATGYTEDRLYHGNAADSSTRAKYRIKWVLDAEEIIMRKYFKEITTLAAEMCRASKGEFE